MLLILLYFFVNWQCNVRVRWIQWNDVQWHSHLHPGYADYQDAWTLQKYVSASRLLNWPNIDDVTAPFRFSLKLRILKAGTFQFVTTQDNASNVHKYLIQNSKECCLLCCYDFLMIYTRLDPTTIEGSKRSYIHYRKTPPSRNVYQVNFRVVYVNRTFTSTI